MHTMVYLWLLLFTYIKFRQLQDNNPTLAYSVARLLLMVQIQQVPMYMPIIWMKCKILTKKSQQKYTRLIQTLNSQLLRRNSQRSRLSDSPLIGHLCCRRRGARLWAFHKTSLHAARAFIHHGLVELTRSLCSFHSSTNLLALFSL